MLQPVLVPESHPTADLPDAHLASGKRRAPRRSVDLPCEVVTRHSDEPELRWATDLSAYGLWLEAREPLRPGEELVVCFEPPMWWPRDRELVLFAGVTRAGWGRREADRGGTGMALDFIDITEHERRALAGWLSWRPVQPARRFGTPRRLATPADKRARAQPVDVRSRRECSHLQGFSPAATR